MEELYYNKYRKEGGKPIGRGASAEVWRVTDVETGVIQALKIYNGMDEHGVQMMRHEFALMANINHQNLLRPLFFGIWENKPFLVLPFCKNGNLGKRKGEFSERDVWKLLRDVAGGLAYLHRKEPPIIHQDIKPENVLVGDEGSYLLTDFGVSAHAKATSRATVSAQLLSVGTLAYMAPEKFDKETAKAIYVESDIWSLGAMAYEMASGNVPFSVGTVEGGMLQLHGAEMPDLPDMFSPSLCNLIYQCLSLRKEDRPTAAEIEEQAATWLGERPTIHPSTLTLDPIIQKPYISDRAGDGLPKQPPYPYKPKPNIKNKGVIWAIIFAAIACISVTIYLFTNRDGGQMESTPPVGMGSAAAMLKNPDTAKEGLKMLQDMASQDDPAAIYLLSRLYFKSNNINDRIPDSVRTMQKALKITSDNIKAHELLKKTIKLAPSNYFALYEIGCDFLGGEARTEAVDRNPKMADEYFQPALKLAEDAGDNDYVELIKQQIEKYAPYLKSE